ncbi:hypothetical protein [Clostridium sp. MCC353]|uniref:N-acetylmuramoyl-L-alanine amidase family protein n=1 Tax=Clostridium sp. MCC353 TaxID=2592646 RepID=UPI001C01BD63|nr:hypothetical protein [Clostridium sp. MCC353]
MKIKKFAVLLLSFALAAGSLITVHGATKERLPEVSDLWWEDEVAHWEEVDDAYKYEVTLYRNSSKVKTIETKNTKYNFENAFTKADSYRFKVRPLGKGEFSDGPWSSYSEEIDISQTYINNLEEERERNKAASVGKGAKGPGETETAGEWVQDQNGWWYKNADGTYPASTWAQVNGVWYFFGEDGYMKTGWINWKNKQYYCDASGAMVTGTYTVEGVAHNFAGDGALMQ